MAAGIAAAATLNVTSTVGPQNYTTIQQAVNNSAAGDTILVYPGTYNENVNVDKQLNITSTGGAAVTNVTALLSNDHVFEVTADNVTIRGFNVSGATVEGNAGIFLSSSNNSTLTDNTVMGDYEGIYLVGSNYNMVTNNMLKYCGSDGIDMDHSNYNSLIDNTASYNDDDGIELSDFSNYNTVTDNTAEYNSNDGIYLNVSSNNNLISNTVSNNSIAGIKLKLSSNNTLIDNTASSDDSLNNYVELIHLLNSSYNTLTGNTAFGGWHGIYLYISSNNDLTNNNASNNGNDGIELEWSGNNTLTSNTVSYAAEDGIEVDWSGNNDLINNKVSNNHYEGIRIVNSSYNTLTGNTAEYNTNDGIDLKNSSYNTLTDNTAEYNGNDGFDIKESSNNNMLSNNTAEYNGNDGIYLGYSSNNTLIGNMLSHNTRDGIDMDYCSISNLTDNKVSYSGEEGIDVDSSSNNRIYNNYFNNTINVGFIGINVGNIWNITKTAGTNVVGGPYIGGNYWSDYSGVDNDGDGIGDSQIDLNASNTDYLPLLLDTTAPVIAVELPQNNADYSTSTVPLNVTGDGTVNKWWYSLNGGANVTFTPNITLPELPDDDYFIMVYANDTVGNEVASALINFSIDTVPPANITNLTVASRTRSSITLSWDVSHDADHVELWRNNVYITDVFGVSHENIGLASATSYNYGLRPVDTAGNVGNWSNITASTQTSSTSSSKKSSSSGGGSGSTGEAFENIAFKDVKTENIISGLEISYVFDEEQNAIQYINFSALRNYGRVSTTIEVLKGRSTLVDESAPGIVYSNLNIWVGISGFATEDNIANPVIGFRVAKEWLTENGLDGNSIALYRYSEGKWNALDTKKVGEDDEFLYFEAKATGFSSFAICALKMDTTPIIAPFPSDDDVITEVPELENEAVSTGLPGFSSLLAIGVLGMVYTLFRRRT